MKKNDIQPKKVVVYLNLYLDTKAGIKQRSFERPCS